MKENIELKCLIGGKYKIIREVGKGSYGLIFLGRNIENGDKIAIKLENASVRNSQLANEYQAYKRLTGVKGIPSIHYFGRVQNYNVLVMDLLGSSLSEFFQKCDNRFSHETHCMLALQMIDRLEDVHEQGLLHRDIKPTNFLMGTQNNRQTVFLIDFGFAKEYVDTHTQAHINYTINNNFIGSMRYASIKAHIGHEQSRRDDLESLGYVLLYFLLGSLPWQTVTSTTNAKQRCERVAERKISIPIEDLCAEAPNELLLYMKHCRKLRFDETPNYNYLRSLFSASLARRKNKRIFTFDWAIARQHQQPFNNKTIPRNSSGRIS